jgi:hypothetical protein
MQKETLFKSARAKKRVALATLHFLCHSKDALEGNDDATSVLGRA